MKAKILVFAILILSGCAPTKTNVVADGSSMDKAIKVNSVSEEYAIVREKCVGCKMKGQALLSGKNGESYDKLMLIKPDGQEVSYYFDITSFFGKW